jgi:hypothetical protein
MPVLSILLCSTGQLSLHLQRGREMRYRANILKWNDQINMYGQFLGFSLGILKGDNSWKNKYGYQLGVKYYNAFHIDNLLLQLE